MMLWLSAGVLVGLADGAVTCDPVELREMVPRRKVDLRLLHWLLWCSAARAKFWYSPAATVGTRKTFVIWALSCW